MQIDLIWGQEQTFTKNIKGNDTCTHFLAFASNIKKLCWNSYNSMWLTNKKYDSYNKIWSWRREDCQNTKTNKTLKMKFEVKGKKMKVRLSSFILSFTKCQQFQFWTPGWKAGNLVVREIDHILAVSTLTEINQGSN